ncbi:MAG: hypothetical protein AB8G77_04910 [Rhodothermales bacterium]
MNDADINYTKEAFLNPWNLGFLIMAMLSAFFLSGAPGTGPLFNIVLILAAASELMYLGIVPRQDRFKRLIKSQRAKERAKPPSQKEIYGLLTKYSQRRYARLRKIEKDIQSNYRKMSYASQGLLESHLKKINGLIESYIKLLYQKERYEDSVRTSAEKEITRDIEELRSDLETQSPRVKAIKKRRLRILEQRLDRFKKSKENLEIIEEQLATIEDVIKYIHEQSLTLRDPEAITFQLDTLLNEVEETEASVEEIEEVFGNPTDLLGDMDSFDIDVSDDISISSKGRERDS